MNAMATLFSSPHNGERAFQAGQYDMAAKDLMPLAQRGNATAQYYIARMYQEGKGLPENKKAAFTWAQKAAAHENGDAEALLGVLYAQGRAVPRDDDEAARWFHKAAARGSALGQSKMGMCCLNGIGVPKDSVKAWMWFHLAASQTTGHDNVCNCHMRDTLATLDLTPAQIEEARKMASEWKPAEPSLLHRLHLA
jgi:TPR repeat protein